MFTRRFTVAAVALLLAVSACGESNEVGSGVDLSFEDQVNQNLNATTTTAPPTTVPAVEGEQAAAIRNQPNTTQATAPPTTQARIEHFEITILGDNQGASQFDPPVAIVKAGTLIRWTNRDSQPRSVVADNGAFDSGMLAPGASFVWKAQGSGRVNYSDGTRPYAVAAVEVQ